MEGKERREVRVGEESGATRQRGDEKGGEKEEERRQNVAGKAEVEMG